jgi:hypothetical protein
VEDKVPTWGFIDHVTAVLFAPVTVAVNWFVWPTANVTGEEMLTATGTRLIVADATTELLAVEVAVTRMVCCEVTGDGAV